ncbi:hypothetical protein VJI77_04730 [Parvimonas sp. D2]|uniref:hypothetical protein n=1 Tax=unclassified Parvimonas TaxID=1151464 RepID=UPI002B47A2FB|nr:MULTISPECIES: hypothetical protein [unclassified Parvimonas]MEB3012299.1 hypothetical protein [Parvimonas sp. D2]MEB3087756.1 hypothetical protein [Parvimonas sp. D4]
MSNFFRYYLIGFKIIWQHSITRNAMIFLFIAFLIIIFRRISIALRSGGSVFRPYHISNGNFYIHNAFYFLNRVIPLKKIRSIEVDRIRSVRLNGSRYMLTIELKNGKRTAFFFGRDKASDELVRNLKQDTKRYNIKIHTINFDK